MTSVGAVEPSEEESMAGDNPKTVADSRRPSASESADAHAAATLQARRAVADHPTPAPPLLSPPLSTPRTHTPDSEAVSPASGTISVKELATPLSEMQRPDMQRPPTQDSVAPQAGSAGTPELIPESAFLPAAKFRPLPAETQVGAMNIPPPSSAPMSRNASENGTRQNRSQSVSSQKKGFLAKMFHHEPKVEKMTPAVNGSPPMTPNATDSDQSRPPSRAPSFKRNKDEPTPDKLERRPSGLQRRLSERTTSHGSAGAGAIAQVAAPEVAVPTSKFTLKDLIGGGKDGKLSRRGSEKGSGRGSDRGSTKGSEAGGEGTSTASLLKKYGICDRAAIGKGATAVVRLAHKWDRREEKLYAVKEFRKRRKNETEKDYVKKLTSEFCISSTLHHINIVETVDLVQDEQQHWCEVMEYCPGGDLYAAIKKGGMSSAEVECTFKQTLHGIQYLHSMGVAHRDIKPENLLLDGRGHVKITDFGVSDVFRMCWEKKTHLSKGLCGSEPYIAPELFEMKEYDARLVDVWAAAVVFYCMQFQELPWRVAKPTDATYATYTSQYYASGARPEGAPACPAPLNNLVPRECRHVIKHMLDPDPKTRWTVDEALKDKWLQSVEVCIEGQRNNHSHTTVPLDVVRMADK